jgi:hypothetical protein
MPADGFMAALAAQQEQSSYPALQPLPEGMFEREMAASDEAAAKKERTSEPKDLSSIAPLILSPTSTTISSGFEVNSSAPLSITTAPVTPARSGIGMGLLGRAMAKQSTTTPSITTTTTTIVSAGPTVVSPQGNKAVSPNGALRQGATTTTQPTIHSGSFRERPHSAIAGSYGGSGIMSGANNNAAANAASANMLGKSPTILSVMQNVGGEFGSLPRSSSGSMGGFQTARSGMSPLYHCTIWA